MAGEIYIGLMTGTSADSLDCAAVEFSDNELNIIGLKNYDIPSNIKEEIIENLNLAKNFIRHTLGQRIEIRRVPDITFKDDKVLEKGLRVLKLLDELKNKSQNQESKVEENNDKS